MVVVLVVLGVVIVLEKVRKTVAWPLIVSCVVQTGLHGVMSFRENLLIARDWEVERSIKYWKRVCHSEIGLVGQYKRVLSLLALAHYHTVSHG